MKFEYFLQELNGWLSLDIEEYINLIFRQEELKINKIKSLVNVPIKIISENNKRNNDSKPENLISGNYVEVLIQKELNLICNNKKKIKLAVKEGRNKKQYNLWARAKIVSYDSRSKITLLEYDDEVLLIDDMCKMRPLSKLASLEDDICIYYLKKISTSEYEKFKKEFENVQNDIDEEIKYLLYHSFNNIKSSLIVICPKTYINNIPSLKQFENKYELSNYEESITGITSRSGISEESDKIDIKSRRSKKSKGSDFIFNEEEMLNQINKYEFKHIFYYKSIFKKDAEKIMKSIIKKNKYYIININSEEFKIILYGNNEADFNEEKVMIEKECKQERLDIEHIMNKSEMMELANEMKVKCIYFVKKNIYLIGDEKSINNFKAVLKVKSMYTKEIQKSNRESQNIQKKLNDIKKEYKIK